MLAGQQRPVAPVLIGVVSRSDSILEWSSTLLSALGFPSDAVIHRNPRARRWKDGLGACDIVAADVIAAAELPEKVRPVVFRVVSERFLTDLSESIGRVTPE